MKTKYCAIALALTLLAGSAFRSLAYAEKANRYRVQIHGFRGAAEAVSAADGRFSNTGTGQPEIRFSARIPGLGRVRIHLDRERTFGTQATFTDEGGTRPDPITPRLLRGSAAIGKSYAATAGAAYRSAGADYLFVGFSSPVAGPGLYYHLAIPLRGSPAPRRFAHVRRLSKWAPAALLADDFLLAPGAAAVSKRGTATAISATGAKIVQLSLDGDAEWYRKFRSSSNAKISEYVNAAENIYEAQLGITFDIVRQNVSSTKSFGTTLALPLLNAYQAYTTASSYFSSADAHHLFTGTELADNVLGVSWLHSICVAPTYAFLLSRASTDAFVPITFAHELGHSFGAAHDESATDSIMSPVLNNPPPQRFSTASRVEIAAFISTYGSCLADSAQPTPTSTPTPAPSSSASPRPTLTGGNNGGNGDPSIPGVKILLRTRLRNGSFDAAVQLTEPHPECRIKFLASTKQQRVLFGRPLLIFSPSSIETHFNVPVTARVAPKRGQQLQKLYLTATIGCPNNAVGMSDVKTLYPERGRGPRVSVGRWLTLLGSELEKVQHD